MIKTITAVVSLGLAIFAVVAAACGDGRDDASVATPTPTGPTYTTGGRTPIPPMTTPTALPAAQRFDLLGPTGVPTVDRIIEAFKQKDSAAMMALSLPLRVPCAQEAYSGELKCPPGIPVGTIYETFPSGHACHGSLLLVSELAGLWTNVLSESLPFWAIARVHDARRDVGYDIIFAAGPAAPADKILMVSPAGITEIAATCADPVGGRYPPGTEFLVPP